MKRACLICATVLFCAASAGAGSAFPPSYTEVVSFPSCEGLSQTRMTMAYDGNYYWSCSGGGPGGIRLAQHDGATGAVIATYSPGIDFRSIWQGAGGTIYGRGFGSNVIYAMTSPGVMTPSGVTLTGGSLDAQSAVVTYGPANEYIAMSDGLVSRWDASGAYLGSVNFSGFGSVPGENNYPAGRGIAAMGDYWLTYSSGVLSAWDQSGNRIDQTTLVGAGIGFDSNFSFSYTNGMVFVDDGPGGMWRGYDVGLSSVVPAPGAVLLGAMGMGLVGWLRRRNTL